MCSASDRCSLGKFSRGQLRSPKGISYPERGPLKICKHVKRHEEMIESAH